MVQLATKITYSIIINVYSNFTLWKYTDASFISDKIVDLKRHKQEWIGPAAFATVVTNTSIILREALYEEALIPLVNRMTRTRVMQKYK